MTHLFYTIAKQRRTFNNGIGLQWLSLFRLFKYFSLTILLLPFQVIILVLCPAGALIIPFFHHKLASLILGLEIIVEGKPTKAKKTLFIANHISYFDIIVIGSIIPGRFIAKSELSKWPVFGFLSKLTKTIFVHRLSNHALKQISFIQERLSELDRLILFPEGTSSDGSRVLPFKSSLFEAPIKVGATVQPITIRYTEVNGMPVDRWQKPLLAWYGDMDLFPHLWKALSLGTIKVELIFHEPISPSDFKDRKELAKYCHKKIQLGAVSCV